MLYGPIIPIQLKLHVSWYKVCIVYRVSMHVAHCGWTNGRMGGDEVVEVRFMKIINVTAMARFGTKSWPIVGWMSSAVNEMSG